jgi:hypothetical protein
MEILFIFCKTRISPRFRKRNRYVTVYPMYIYIQYHVSSTSGYTTFWVWVPGSLMEIEHGPDL